MRSQNTTTLLTPFNRPPRNVRRPIGHLAASGLLALLALWGPLSANGAEHGAAVPPAQRELQLRYELPHWLTIEGTHLPGGPIRINYLEAYCRANSTDADWVQHTVIPHQVEYISSHDICKSLRLRDRLADGVTVEHTIVAEEGEVSFALTAHNPGESASAVHWAQPCVRLGKFTGYADDNPNIDDYLPQCFILLEGKPTRLSDVQPWAKQARYTPGQVWCPLGVPRTDVNPRPLSPLVPSHGLIGAYSHDGKMLFATAWEPYQELFQGVARCLHSDLRIGGLEPGETKTIRGKIYLLETNIDTLLAKYQQDFPEHTPVAK